MRNLNERFVLGCAPLVALLFVFSASVPLLAQSDGRYGISETKNVMVAMRDGVKLAADIYRPTRNGEPVGGKFMVILLRTPYNKGGGPQSSRAVNCARFERPIDFH